jgi:hypothetical protein
MDAPLTLIFQDVVAPASQFVLLIMADNSSKINCDVPMAIFYDYQEHISMRQTMGILKCRTADCNQWGKPNPPKPAG